LIFDTIINLKDSFKREPIALNMDETSAKSIIDQFNDMKLSADAFIERTGLSDEAMKSYLYTVESGKATFAGCTQYVNAASNSIGLMGVKAKATSLLLGGLKAAAGMLVTTLLAMAIGKIIEGFDNFVHRSEKIAEAAETAKQNIDKLTTSFEEQKASIDEIKERYAELAQGVDLINNKNLTLSTEDYEEFLDLSNQLAELFPELTKGYDSNGNAILNLSGNVNTIVGSLDALLEREKELLNKQILEEMPEVYAGYKVNYDEYNEELNRLDKKNQKLKELMDIGYSIYESDESENVVLRWKFTSDIDENTLSDMENQLYNVLDGIHDGLSDSIIEYLDPITGGKTLRIVIPKIEYEGYGGIEAAFGEYMADINGDIQLAKAELQKETSEFNQYLNTWLNDTAVYQNISNDTLKTALNELIFDGNWIEEAFKDPDVDEDSFDSIADWLEKNYLNVIGKVNNTEIQEKLIDLFSLDNPQEKLTLAQELQDYFNKNNIKISLDFILDKENNDSIANLVERVKTKNNE